MSSSETSGVTPRGRPKPLRSALAALFAAMLLAPLTWTHEYQELEHAALDLQARARTAVGSAEVVIVAIDDHDYASIFGGRSPLDPVALTSLIRTVAQGRPRAIGIDIETSDGSFLQLRELADSLRTNGGPPVVWGQDALTECEEDRHAEGHDCEGASIEPLGVLGGPVSEGQQTGVVLALQDAGGTIRRFRAMLPTATGQVPSFPWALWRAYDPENAVRFDTTRPRYIRFHRPDPEASQFSASSLIRLAATPGFKSGLVLGGKIVLLGGSFRAGRDEYHTPVGILPGVAIHAQTLETILSGGGSAVPSVLHIATLQLVVGSVLVIALSQLGFGGAILLSLGVATIFAFLGSLVLTGSLTEGLPYFAPLAVVVVIALAHEHLSFYRAALTEKVFELATGRPTRHSVDESLERAETSVGRLQAKVIASRKALAQRCTTLVDRLKAGVGTRRTRHNEVPTPPDTSDVPSASAGVQGSIDNPA